MEFGEIKERFKKMQLDTIRIDNDSHFEVVVKKAVLDGIVRALENIFGPPAWPSRRKLAKDVEKVINEAGGLRKGQTLYCMKNESDLTYAMLWPWQDNERITIKVLKA